MRTLPNRARRLAVSAVLLTAAGCSAAGCTLHDLGPFSMCVPATWTLTQGGIDSAAGHFQDGQLRVSYDFGPYSNRLAIPADCTNVTEAPIQIDGHPGRRVAYTCSSPKLTHYVGVHIPEVSRSSMGPNRLTLLATAPTADLLRPVDKAFETVRVKPTPPKR